MKLLFALVFVVMLLSSLQYVEATENKVYDNWHYFVDEFTYNNSLYVVRLFPNDFDKVKLDVDGYPLFIDLDEDEEKCQRLDNYKYCYVAQSFEPKNKADFSYDGVNVPGVKIIIYSVFDSRNVKISKTMVPTSLHLGEEGVVTVKISNTGELTAYAVEAAESIPRGLKLERTLGIANFQKFGSNKFVTYAVIAPNKDYEYRYVVSMNTFIDQDLITNLTYQWDNGDLFRESNVLNVKLNGFSVGYQFSPSKTDVNKFSEFSVTLANTEPEAEPVDILSLLVDFPLGISVVPLSSQIITLGSNNFLIQDTVKAERENKYSFNVKAPYVGEYDAKIDLDIFALGTRMVSNDSRTLQVGTDLLLPSLRITPERLRAGNEVIIQAHIENVKEKESFYNIKGELKSDILTVPFEYEEMAGLELHDLYPRRRVRIPLSSDDEELVFNLSGTYETQSGEQLTFTTVAKVNLVPASKSFSIEIVPDKKVMHLTDENTIIVTVQNLLGDSVNDLGISDETSRPINLISGFTRVSLSLLGNQEKQAYIYKFSLPNNFPDNFLNITTLVTAPSKSYQEVIVTKIDINRSEVDPIDIVDPANPVGNNNSDETIDVIEVVCEQGEILEDGVCLKPVSDSFWDKFAAFFKGLFSSRS